MDIAAKCPETFKCPEIIRPGCQERQCGNTGSCIAKSDGTIELGIDRFASSGQISDPPVFLFVQPFCKNILIFRISKSAYIPLRREGRVIPVNLW
jgi:hypothetical protein